MIPHNRPTLGPLESAAATKAIESNWVAQGPNVDAFERELAEYLGVCEGGVVAVSSGSAALYLALWILKATSAALPVYACAALRNAVGLIGAEASYVDCSPDSPNTDPAGVKVTGAQVAITASIFGIPAVLPSSHQIIIEDIAQAIGSNVNGVRIGLRGAVGICSFSATKLMTTAGQGGALIAADPSLAEAVRDYREFDARDDSRLRFNFQMTDVQAAVGRVQLSRLDRFLIRRQEIFGAYADAGVELMGNNLPHGSVARYRAVMQSEAQRDIIKRLEVAGISAIVPVEKYELLSDSGGFPNALKLTETAVSLPIYPSLTDPEVESVIRVVQGHP